ncbi:hypothetical protein ABH307_00730 [Acinetobacter pittii]|uniref:hypothetical protein n=1 Tax=Acinetobacter pittii TaxID=48296 RepID=UPI0032617334
MGTFTKSDLYITTFLTIQALEEMLRKAKENNPNNIPDEEIMGSILNEITNNPTGNTAKYFIELMNLGNKTVNAVSLGLKGNEIIEQVFKENR